jgi:hypothetical protein
LGHAERQLALAYRYYWIGETKQTRLHLLRSIQADPRSLLSRPHILVSLFGISLLGRRFARAFSSVERRIHALVRNIGAV